MNQTQEQRLEEIFKTNDNNGIAIAIIGSWGVGKTFAWNKFLEIRAKFEEEKIKHLPAFQRNKDQRIFSKKYAYVSLFGIENLSDLKAAISTNMSSNYFNQESSKNFEIPTFIKKGLTALREVKLTSSEYGISSSARIFESMLYAQVKDAIICFDDFERMSKNIDIKDVMGLANQLKLERNCQVVLILDESKNEDENKNKYAEYKEKLIDETIKITSVEPLICAHTKGIDDALIDLMVKFADELEIHNFRFFQKVIKLYKHFLEQLPAEVAYSTKEIILIRVIQCYFITDFGVKYEFQWENIQLVLEDNQKDWSERKVKTYKALRNISYNFIHSDVWLSEFKKWFDQVDELDLSLLKELASSELISEKNQILKNKLWDIFDRRFNLIINESDFTFLAELGGDLIQVETIYNVAITYEFIKEYLDDESKFKKFQKDVLKVLDSDLGQAISRKNEEIRLWDYPNNIFYEHIDKLAENYKEDKDLKGIISHYLQYDYFKEEEDKHKLNEFLLNDWYQYLTVDIYQEKFYLDKDKTIIACLRKLSKIKVDDFYMKDMMVMVLNKIGEESEFKRKYMNDIIKNHLD